MTQRDSTPTRPWLAAGFLALLAAAIWLAYSPGLSASYYFDDAPNLTGLERVSDQRSALEFVLSGHSGPTGRPLALSSFLLNVEDWPDRPDRLRRVNVLIHLINAMLVVWLALSLARAGGVDEKRALTAALIAGSAWSLLPILASTSMMITQRMTSLSALFVLLGLLTFAACHRRLATSPRAAVFGMSAGLAVFTALAVLCKENGALLPVYALSMTILLPKPGRLNPTLWRAWKGLFLWLPLLLIVGYLAQRIPYEASTVHLRDFSAWERLITQARVLWQYLFNSLLPMSTAQFGPFHDNLRVSNSLLEPVALVAVAGWAAMLAAAVALRKRQPVFSFAVFWFLGGHLVESTVIPLELYFEHRNYLPLIGPAFGLGWLVINVPRKWTRLAMTAAVSYIVLLGWTTMAVTDEWGSPLQFAETQYRHNRDSPRAAGFLATHLMAIDRPDLAWTIIDQIIARDRDAMRLRMAGYQIRCAAFPDSPPAIDTEALAMTLRRAEADRNLARAVHDLLNYRTSTGCPAMSVEDMRKLVNALASNDELSEHAESRYWVNRARALIASISGNEAMRREQLWKALQHRFEPFALELMIQSYLQDGMPEAACDRLQDLWHTAEGNPLRQRYIRMVIARMAASIKHSTATVQPCVTDVAQKPR